MQSEKNQKLFEQNIHPSARRRKRASFGGWNTLLARSRKNVSAVLQTRFSTKLLFTRNSHSSSRSYNRRRKKHEPILCKFMNRYPNDGKASQGAWSSEYFWEWQSHPPPRMRQRKCALRKMPQNANGNKARVKKYRRNTSLHDDLSGDKLWELYSTFPDGWLLIAGVRNLWCLSPNQREMVSSEEPSPNTAQSYRKASFSFLSQRWLGDGENESRTLFSLLYLIRLG